MAIIICVTHSSCAKQFSLQSSAKCAEECENVKR